MLPDFEELSNLDEDQYQILSYLLEVDLQGHRIKPLISNIIPMYIHIRTIFITFSLLLGVSKEIIETGCYASISKNLKTKLCR